MSTHNLCFEQKKRKIMYTPVNPRFTRKTYIGMEKLLSWGVKSVLPARAKAHLKSDAAPDHKHIDGPHRSHLPHP